MNSQNNWPRVDDWLIKVPLYREIEYKDEQVWDIIKIKHYNETLDSYCVECKKESTFRGVNPERPASLIRSITSELRRKASGLDPGYPDIEGGTFQVILECTRETSHLQYIFFLVRHHIIFSSDFTNREKFSYFQKVGQYPSYGDLQIPKLKKYSGVLSEKDLSELTRAIGLASHDVGIGAYCYLRRVFESLIEEAHNIAKGDANWGEENYNCARMDQRINMLKEHLPDFLVKNPKMYSLLSKGLHELTEDECLNHFNTLKICIELILDEKVEKKEKEKKINEAEKALGNAINETK
ncbi:MAG TPA: hypothetical protein VMW95_09530 [Desulfobacterales bacterium]|nr:hypothetical protein [Desulfobacterales bacterium]